MEVPRTRNDVAGYVGWSSGMRGTAPSRSASSSIVLSSRPTATSMRASAARSTSSVRTSASRQRTPSAFPRTANAWEPTSTPPIRKTGANDASTRASAAGSTYAPPARAMAMSSARDEASMRAARQRSTSRAVSGESGPMYVCTFLPAGRVWAYQSRRPRTFLDTSDTPLPRWPTVDTRSWSRSRAYAVCASSASRSKSGSTALLYADP